MFPLPTSLLKSLLLNNNKKVHFLLFIRFLNSFSQYIATLSPFTSTAGFYGEERECETAKALSAVSALPEVLLGSERTGEEALLGDTKEYLHEGATGTSALCRRRDQLELLSQDVLV